MLPLENEMTYGFLVDVPIKLGLPANYVEAVRIVIRSICPKDPVQLELLKTSRNSVQVRYKSTSQEDANDFASRLDSFIRAVT